MRSPSSPLPVVSVSCEESVYETFRADPNSFDESWRCLLGVLDLVGQEFRSVATSSQPVLVRTGRRRQLDRALQQQDLVRDRDRHDRRSHPNVAVVALDELYLYPAAGLEDVFERWPDGPCVWVQEQARNMRAWSDLDRRIEQTRHNMGCRSAGVAYVGRPEAGSPAGFFHGDHDDEQARNVAIASDAVGHVEHPSGPTNSERSRFFDVGVLGKGVRRATTNGKAFGDPDGLNAHGRQGAPDAVARGRRSASSKTA